MRPAVRVAAVVVFAASAAAARAGDLVVTPIDPPQALEKDIVVLDAVTRTPVAGARVRRYAEGSVPIAIHLGTWRAGSDGRVRVAAGTYTSDSHWVIDAPGRAPTTDYGTLPHHSEQTLRPPQPFSFTLLDGLGRPVTDADVEAIDGCGHAPTLATSRADARGVVRFDGLAVDGTILWPVAPGSASRYVGADDELVIDARTGALALVLRPGGVCSGLVVDGDGKPLQEVSMHVMGSDRGPSALTGPDGRFRLVGAEYDGASLSLWHPLGEEEARLSGDPATWRSGAGLILRLTPAGLEWDDAPARSVVFEAPAAPGAEDAGRERVLATNTADGRVFEIPADETEDAGEAAAAPPATFSTELPPGRYVVTSKARGGPAPFVQLALDVVAADDGKAQRVSLVRAPSARLVVTGSVPSGARVALAVPSRDVPCDTPEDPAAWSPRIELQGEAVVRVEWDGGVHFFGVAAAKDGVRHASIEVPGRSWVALGTDYSSDSSIELTRDGVHVPFVRDTDRLWTDASGALRLSVGRAGNRVSADIVARGDGGFCATELDRPASFALDRAREAVVRVVLPDVGDDSVRVEVFDARGDEVLGVTDPEVSPTFYLDGTATIVVTRDSHTRRVIPVTKPGDVAVSWGTATLTLRVRDGEGRPCAARLTEAGEGVAAAGDDGVLVLRGLAAGTFDGTLVAEAAPHHGARIRATLADGENLAGDVILAEAE